MKKISLIVLFLAFAISSFCFGQNFDESTIILVRKKGLVCLWDLSTRKWAEMSAKDKIKIGDFLKTGEESEAIISFGKKAVITVAENSMLRITTTIFEKGNIGKIKIQMPKGKIWSAVEKLSTPESKFEIETPNALAGVRGTVFMVGVKPEEDSTRISVVEGEVSVSSTRTEGYVLLKENMSTTVVANKPPVSPYALEEKEKQEWEEWKQSIPFSEIGIVGGIAEMNAMQIQDAARIVRELGIAKKGSKKVLKDFENIESAVVLFYADTKTVPKKLKDLIYNPEITNWAGPYLGVGTNFQDPYGRPYQYKAKKTPGGKEYIELFTFGLVGAHGDTYGEEKKLIFVDKLEKKLK